MSELDPPLVIMTVFNREAETFRTLEALERTTDPRTIQLAIIDNGSTDDMGEKLAQYQLARLQGGSLIMLRRMKQNIGCPRALNYAVKLWRGDGQPVVKLDNDVEILTPGWVDMVTRLVVGYMGEDRRLAMVSAFYDGLCEDRVKGEPETVPGSQDPLHHIFPVVGHTVWHTAAFMDRVGFFDVLSPEHLYGFEDLILSHKAGCLEWDMVTWEGWRIENVQRHSALGDKRDSHVAAMRPLYDERVQLIYSGGSLWTGPDGLPGATSGSTYKDTEGSGLH